MNIPELCQEAFKNALWDYLNWVAWNYLIPWCWSYVNKLCLF